MHSRQPRLTRSAGTVSLLLLLWVAAKYLRRKRSRADTAGLFCFRPRGLALQSVLLFAADLLAIPFILRNKPRITGEELANIYDTQLPFIDRGAMRQCGRREDVRSFSDNVLRLIVATPAILLLNRSFRNESGPLFILYAWVHAVTYSIYSFSPLGPAFNDRFRPLAYFDDVPIEQRIRGNNRNAMYSGHTGNAACASFFMVKLYSGYHPEMTANQKAVLYAIALLPPAFLGWLRVRAGKHFPSDVLLAIAIGAGCGVLLPELYED